MMAAMKLEDQGMTLKQLLSAFVTIDCLPDVPVTGLCLDSREVQPGNVFVALAGQTDHGLAFAEAAISKGAIAVLCDRKFDAYCQEILSALMTRAICIPVYNLKEKLGEIASRFYQEPSKDLFTVGVTGTDGKTSVSHFIAQALDEPNHRSAVIGTIGNGIMGRLMPATHTTPDVIQLHRLLTELYDTGAESVAMEVSSHGLDQGRLDAVQLDVAVLTNLGRDHLDYHGDLDAYAKAKKRLFKQPGLKAAVLNMDDAFGRQLAVELKQQMTVWGYSLQSEVEDSVENMLTVSRIETQSAGQLIHICSPMGEQDAYLPLLGEFNVANALATLAVLLIKEIPFADAVKRIENLVTVAGRMESFYAEGRPLVIVDYAHTPQALESVLRTLRKHCEHELYCVFGCGGDRDKGNRPLMAKAAEEFADRVIVTNDNPRTENTEQIIMDIQSGFSDQSLIDVIQDRQQAIATAISQATARDIVLVAGKGHEDYQIIGREKLPFSDTQVVRECLGLVE